MLIKYLLSYVRDHANPKEKSPGRNYNSMFSINHRISTEKPKLCTANKLLSNHLLFYPFKKSKGLFSPKISI